MTHATQGLPMHTDTQTQPRQLLAEALATATTMLDTDRRAWVIGIAWLREAEGPGTPRGVDVDEILRACRENAEFPCGAMGYVTLDGEPEINESYEMASLHHRRDGEDYLDIRVAVGVEGFLGYGFTRSGVLGERGGLPSHVLLTDVEAAIADLGTLAAFSTAHLGYEGPVDTVVGIGWSAGDVPLWLRALDPESGELGPGLEASAFEPVFGSFGTDRDFQTQYGEVLRMATEVAQQFGMSGPQLMTAPELLPVDVDEIEQAVRDTPAGPR